MAKQDDNLLNEGCTPIPKKNNAPTIWVEKYGGLVYLIILVLVLSSVILCDFLMY